MAKEQATSAFTLTLTRTFAAPRDKVFLAWTDARQLAAWFLPGPGFSARVAELDLRIGGRYRLQITHPGGEIHEVTGIYREISAPQRLAFTWRWTHDPENQEMMVTLDFRDLGPSTEMTLTHALLPSQQERDKHSHGWNGCLNQLATFLQS